jgi:hypothetical protein
MNAQRGQFGLFDGASWESMEKKIDGPQDRVSNAREH